MVGNTRDCPRKTSHATINRHCLREANEAISRSALGLRAPFPQLNIQRVVYRNWEALDSLSSPHLAGFQIGTKLFVASPLDKQAGVPLNCLKKATTLEASLGCPGWWVNVRMKFWFSCVSVFSRMSRELPSQPRKPS